MIKERLRKYTYLHTDLRRAAAAQPSYDYADPRPVRERMSRNIAIAESAGFWPRHDEAVDWTDQTVPRSRVPVRVYRPAGGIARPGPAVVFFHGGGFMIGDLDLEHPRCLEMCRTARAIVISVDYRLAPEHPYPAALEDCHRALSWVLDRGAEWGVRTDRVAVSGASAGGCLAAGCALLRRDEGRRLPRFLALIYPVLDDRMTTASMTRDHDDTPVWSRRHSRHMWEHYLGAGSAATDVPPYAAPARAACLRGLPPTYVMTAEHDPLRDEGLGFATRLLRAGVPVEVHNYAGAFHGFDTLSDSTLSSRARTEHYLLLEASLHSD